MIYRQGILLKSQLFIPDLLITIPAFLLISLGILVIYSSDPKLALQQAIFALIGLVIYWVLSGIDYESWDAYINYFYIAITILLVVVFLIGIETRGSLRWIYLGGISIQPSEIAKPVMILMLAKFWSKKKTSWKNIFKSLVLTSPIVFLIFLQPDLGTALTVLAIWLVILIGANISAFKMLVMGFISSTFVPILWHFLQDYQKNRIISFLSPSSDPLGNGYNVIQSMIAVGSGQIMGRGLGRGTQSRLRFLPEYKTDFIFSSIAEEFGLIGSLIVLSLYVLIISRSLFIVNRIRNRFSSLLVLGVVGMLFFQITVNVGMNIGIAPVTGITLPLLSYGGSSLLTTLISLSFIASAVKVASREETVY